MYYKAGIARTYGVATQLPILPAYVMYPKWLAVLSKVNGFMNTKANLYREYIIIYTPAHINKSLQWLWLNP